MWQSRSVRPLVALTFASFTVGVTEFVVTGLMPAVARGLHVSIALAGQFVAIYALAIAFGSPILATLSGRMGAGPLVGLFLVACAGGNLICALAPGGAIFALGRIVSAVSHGAFIGVGSAAASDLAPPGQRGRAVGIMLAGLAFANALGVPAAVALGARFGWQSAFVAAAAVNVLAGIALVATMPAGVRVAPAAVADKGWWHDRGLMQTLAVSVLLTGGTFMVFTFVVPLLEQVSLVPARAIKYVLILFGCGLTAGNLLGGCFPDDRRDVPLLISLAGLTGILCILGSVVHRQWEAVLTIVAMTIAWFAAETGLQMRAIDCASTGSELHSTLNGSAISIGCAAGACLGSLLLSAGEPLAALPWAGAVIVGFGAVLAMTTFSQRMTARTR